MKQKPFNLAVKETREIIAHVINESNLAISIVELILENLLQEVRLKLPAMLAAEKQYFEAAGEVEPADPAEEAAEPVEPDMPQADI